MKYYLHAPGVVQADLAYDSWDSAFDAAHRLAMKYGVSVKILRLEGVLRVKYELDREFDKDRMEDWL